MSSGRVQASAKSQIGEKWCRVAKAAARRSSGERCLADLGVAVWGEGALRVKGGGVRLPPPSNVGRRLDVRRFKPRSTADHPCDGCDTVSPRLRRPASMPGRWRAV